MILHEYIKYEFVRNGINHINIYPNPGKTKLELKLAGFLKKKDQDIVIVDNSIKKEKSLIKWGPLASENVYDDYGSKYTEKSLIINVRSQLSSIAKNTDTLFERTFAEALNLHIVYPKAILGDVYMIPVYEYDEQSMSCCPNIKITPFFMK